MTPLVVTVAAIVLAQAQPARLETKSEMLAAIYGRTLGAAAQCNTATRARIDHAAALASAHVKHLAANPADERAAGKALDAGVARGSRDVASGATTCAQAASEFGDLEHELAATH